MILFSDVLAWIFLVLNILVILSVLLDDSKEARLLVLMKGRGVLLRFVRTNIVTAIICATWLLTGPGVE